MSLDIRSYTRAMQDAVQAHATFQEQDAQLRENRELRPELLRQRRAQLADATRQTFTTMFDRLLDQATAAAKQTPTPEPTLEQPVGKNDRTGERATRMSFHPSMRPGYGSWWTTWQRVGVSRNGWKRLRPQRSAIVTIGDSSLGLRASMPSLRPPRVLRSAHVPPMRRPRPSSITCSGSCGNSRLCRWRTLPDPASGSSSRSG